MTSPIDAAVAPLLAALAPPGGSAVVVAPPGTGKTTRLPLALLDAPWASSGRIVVLEPRRLATRAAARRMADLLGDDVGGTVGYVTRDDRRISARTRIEVVTEGVLTRRLQRDPGLSGTSLVIFDEVHERNVHTDVGLALALDARRILRDDLRICAMSATVAARRLAELIGYPDAPAPIISVDAQPFPIDVRWMPRQANQRLEPAVAAGVEAALRRETGDVLVFLPGVREITQVGQLLAHLPAAQATDVRPLYGMLSNEEQDAALRPSPAGRRRVVLATDIAESSLTVDGVRIVVDSGLARAPRFDPRTGMTRLQTINVSRASADQRAGRAGRLGPGVVYRLWSKGEQAARRPFGEPEILQIDLANFALELAAWGTSDPTTLPFIDLPPERSFAEARELLTRLGALDGSGWLTPLGREMNHLPLHPRLAAMVARSAATSPERAGLACVIAALLEERDVMRGRPDEVPTDLATRVELIGDPGRRHPQADGRALSTARRRAGELIRRIDLHVSVTDVAEVPNVTAMAELLAIAYPDRLAIRRAQVGRFQLPNGTAAWVPATDPLAHEPFVVVADMEGDRREARIRLATAIDSASLGEIFGTEVTETERLTWDTRRDELVEVIERRLGGVMLDDISRKPEPGPFVIDALISRVRERGVEGALTWSADATAQRGRVAFLNRVIGDPWPDWSIPRLTDTLEEWLAPFLLFARSRADLEAIDPATVLGAGLDPRLRSDLDRLAPTHFTRNPSATGRRFAIGYDNADQPVLAIRVQELFGLSQGPTVAGGRVKVLLHLLSPAGRPVQITSDLAGFWSGSWTEVRKEMAGRYPKHAWPVDPARADPPRR